MPGARLTHEDRQRIAVWLTEGLAYAEIARRLGKPTSTISREVARNGGPGRYRADRAQRATSRRARRPKPTKAAESTDERQTAVAREFVDQFATRLAATGLPKMSARVFSCLLTADSGSLTAADLVRRLGVSPASVSKAIAYLEAMELVAREPDLGAPPRERYLIDDDVWLRAWQADTGAHGEVAAATRRGVEIFGADTPAGARLGQLGQFFGRLGEQMGGSDLAEGVGYDALTVIAALVHAARPLRVADLATALDWSRTRVVAAVAAIERRPGLADPLALRSTGPDTHAITTRPDRLTAAQRDALTAPATS